MKASFGHSEALRICDTSDMCVIPVNINRPLSDSGLVKKALSV